MLALVKVCAVVVSRMGETETTAVTAVLGKETERRAFFVIVILGNLLLMLRLFLNADDGVYISDGGRRIDCREIGQRGRIGRQGKRIVVVIVIINCTTNLMCRVLAHVMMMSGRWRRRRQIRGRTRSMLGEEVFLGDRRGRCGSRRGEGGDKVVVVIMMVVDALVRMTLDGSVGHLSDRR